MTDVSDSSANPKPGALIGKGAQADVSGVMGLRFMLTIMINLAPGVSDTLKDQVLSILETLPDASTFCHGDFHPENILVSPGGPVVIDWQGGAWGSPVTDHARSWLLSRRWDGGYPWASEVTQTFGSA